MTEQNDELYGMTENVGIKCDVGIDWNEMLDRTGYDGMGWNGTGWGRT